jgi:hypothetical protein
MEQDQNDTTRTAIKKLKKYVGQRRQVSNRIIHLPTARRFSFMVASSCCMSSALEYLVGDGACAYKSAQMCV